MDVDAREREDESAIALYWNGLFNTLSKKTQELCGVTIQMLRCKISRAARCDDAMRYSRRALHQSFLGQWSKPRSRPDKKRDKSSELHSPTVREEILTP